MVSRMRSTSEPTSSKRTPERPASKLCHAVAPCQCTLEVSITCACALLPCQGSLLGSYLLITDSASFQPRTRHLVITGSGPSKQSHRLSHAAYQLPPSGMGDAVQQLDCRTHWLYPVSLSCCALNMIVAGQQAAVLSWLLISTSEPLVRSCMQEFHDKQLSVWRPDGDLAVITAHQSSKSSQAYLSMVSAATWASSDAMAGIHRYAKPWSPLHGVQNHAEAHE